MHWKAELTINRHMNSGACESFDPWRQLPLEGLDGDLATVGSLIRNACPVNEEVEDACSGK